MNVLHAEIMDAWDQVARIMVGNGGARAWVSPCKARQAGSFQQLPHASWTRPKSGTWVEISLPEVRHVLSFACSNMLLRFGKEPGCQTKGITMGSSLGGALFRLVLVVHEMHAVVGDLPVTQIVNSRVPGAHVSCLRFMDDVRVFIVAPLSYSLRRLHDAAIEFLTHVYPPHFPMKPDSVNPCVGLELVLGRQLHWTAHTKGLTCGYDNKPSLCAPFVSAQPVQQKHAIVSGAFARCKQLSSSLHWTMVSLADACYKFTHEGGYPDSLISKWLKEWCTAVFGKRGLQLHQDVLARVGKSEQHASPIHRDSFLSDVVFCAVGTTDWRCV